MIDVSANAQPTTVVSYLQYLGASAAVWRKSTQLSLTTVFGNATTQQDVPPSASPWTSPPLSNKAHFFNCHGAPADPKWYGQVGNSYPTAHESKSVLGKVTLGTVVAAECCYGAQLYDPNLANGEMPICNAYLQSGAYGFWGSSTIAYGPAASNDQADLMCQYFLDELLKGASIGRAALVARQRYARKAATLSPTDLKTLGQFLVFGDVSNQCVKTQDSIEGSMKGIVPQEEAAEKARVQRRARLLLDGNEIAQSRSILYEASTVPPPVEITEFIARFGLNNPKTLSLRVLRRAQAAAFGAHAGPEATEITDFYIVQEPASPRDIFRMVEVAASGSTVVYAKELYSR